MHYIKTIHDASVGAEASVSGAEASVSGASSNNSSKRTADVMNGNADDTNTLANNHKRRNSNEDVVQANPQPTTSQPNQAPVTTSLNFEAAVGKAGPIAEHSKVAPDPIYCIMHDEVSTCTLWCFCTPYSFDKICM